MAGAQHGMAAGAAAAAAASWWLAVVVLAAPCSAIERPEDFVHPLAGTFTDGQRFSTGNTLPLVGRPWGFNHFAPQTNDGYSSWWFNGNDHTLHWMRLTHQPSPWIGDYGWFNFGPQMGPKTENPSTFWEPRAAVIKPHLFDATTGPDGMRIEVAPTLHGAIMRVTFPKLNPAGHDKNVCFKNDGHASPGWKDVDRSTGAATGLSTRVNGNAPGFGIHMKIKSDTPPVNDWNGGKMLCFEYGPAAEEVVVRFATSFVSPNQAQVSLDREMPAHMTFEDVAADARREWNELLGRVDVVDAGPQSDETDRHLGVFYTGLYRALCFPRRLDETDANGKVIHYSPYAQTASIKSGVLVTDNGFWDTFRTVYPMLSLIYPDHLGWIIQGWLNAFVEGGWLPKWASPGYRSSMVGTFADVVVADAIVKNVQGFDKRLAWQALHKDSFEPEPRRGGGAVAKVGLGEYDNHHYIPSDSGVGEFVSRSLDFAFADAAVARAARALVEEDQNLHGLLNDALRLEQRSTDVLQNLYDPSSGLMRPKRRNGQWDQLSPTRWGGGYTEGSPWHHSFPPFHMEKLIQLHGGKQQLAKKLHELVNSPGTFETGGYGQVIHEMAEMRAFAMGQYGHNNQPCHHLLWLFALVGEPSTTRHYIRKVMERGYGTDYYAGDEDNGEMGAWFVLAALGLYAVNPGTDEYVLGSPLFRHVRIQGSEGTVTDETSLGIVPITRSFDIIARGTAKNVVDVQSVTWNEQDLAGSATISDLLIQQGGRLRFVMEGEDPRSPAIPHSPQVHEPSTGSAMGGALSGGGDSAAVAAELHRTAQRADAAESERIKLDEQVRYLEEQLEEERSHGQQAKASVDLLTREHTNDKQSWTHDTGKQTSRPLHSPAPSHIDIRTNLDGQRLQKALAEQAQEVSELREQLSRSVQSTSQAISSHQGSKAELEALKVELALEQKEHKRSNLLQQMHLEQMERILNAHHELDNVLAGASQIAAPLARLGLSHESILVILLVSGLLTLAGLVLYLFGASPVGGSLLGPRKSASHIV